MCMFCSVWLFFSSVYKQTFLLITAVATCRLCFSTSRTSIPRWQDYSSVCVCVSSDDEREQVERLRWPSRGYLQELSEYQQRRRKLRKSRCTVMWRPHTGQPGAEAVLCGMTGRTWGPLTRPFVASGRRNEDKRRPSDAVTPFPPNPPLCRPLEHWRGVVGIKEQFLKTSNQFRWVCGPPARPGLSGRRLDFYWPVQRRICGMNSGTKRRDLKDAYKSADQILAEAGQFSPHHLGSRPDEASGPVESNLKKFCTCSISLAGRCWWTN